MFLCHFDLVGSVRPLTVQPLYLESESCDNLYPAVFVLLGAVNLLLVARRPVSYHGYLSFDPFFRIVGS